MISELEPALLPPAIAAVAWVYVATFRWRSVALYHRLRPNPQARTDLRHVTALIPTCNDEATIGLTLRRTLEQGRLRAIVLVDAQSSDATTDIAARMAAGTDTPVRIVRGTQPPPGWQTLQWRLQQGLRQVDTPWVVTIGPGIELVPYALATLCEHAWRKGIAWSSLVPAPMASGLPQRWLAPALDHLAELLFPTGHGPRRRFQASTRLTLARVDALTGIHGFADVSGASDAGGELVRRLGARKHRVWSGVSHMARIGPSGVRLSGYIRSTPLARLIVRPVRLCAVCLGMGALLWAPVIAVTQHWPMAGLGLLGWVSLGLACLPRLRYHGLPAATGLFAPAWLTAGLLVLAREAFGPGHDLALPLLRSTTDQPSS